MVDDVVGCLDSMRQSVRGWAQLGNGDSTRL